MAAWHYRCEVVPITNFLKYHSVIPQQIDLNVENSEYIDYWDIEAPLIEKIKQDFSIYYSGTETWGNGISFANFTDSAVEVFPDYIDCKLNLLNVDSKFLRVLADITKANKCLFTCSTENGKVFEPTLENLLYEMKHSQKHIFLTKWRNGSVDRRIK